MNEEQRTRVYADGKTLAEQPRWCQDFPTDIAEDDALARREFTKFLVLTSGAFVAGQCWIGLMTILQQEGPYPEQALARAADLIPGSIVEFRYPTEDDPGLLICLDGGRLVAYGQKCTHLSCAVVPEVAAARLQCPCHHATFEIHEGRPIAGPPRRPLPRITLSVRDGIVYATGVELRST